MSSISWLTNSALVYEPNAGAGLWGLSQWAQLCAWSPNKLWRSNSIFNLQYMSRWFHCVWRCIAMCTCSGPTGSTPPSSRGSSTPPSSPSFSWLGRLFIKTFLGPQMALALQRDAISQGPKTSRFPGFNPLLHCKKKVHEFPVSSRDVTSQTPPGQE